MIAVPREDGGVTVHGSLQCPYYIHKAMKRALNMGDELAVVVQAETGGGFGGKEEYPSMIALHAALLALKCHKPVRMIYDRHEDISATTKRHPAVVRYRCGVTGTGELVAQEIEVIMDGGAYCTLTPVVLSPRRAARRRSVSLRERPDHGSRDGHQHAAQRRLPRLRRAADRVRRRDAGQPHRRGAGCQSPLDLRRRWVYREGDTTPTGQVLRESVGGIDVLEAAAEASAFDRHARADARHPRGPRPTARARRLRHRPGAGVARRRLHRLRRGQARIGRQRSS